MIPAVVLFRDWKHYDKRTKIYRWITWVVLVVWFSATFGVGWTMWMDFSQKEKSPSFAFYLNNTRLIRDSVITLPWTNGVLELQITIVNDGNISADGFNAEVVFPNELPLVSTTGWEKTDTLLITGNSLKSIKSQRFFCAGGTTIRPDNLVPLPPISLDCSHLESVKFSIDVFASTKNTGGFKTWDYVRFQRGINEAYLEKGVPGGTWFGIFPK